MESSAQAELLEVFKDLDTDGSGTIGAEELREGLRAVNIPAARVAKLINATDADGSGEIDFAEWRKAIFGRRSTTVDRRSTMIY